MNINNSSLPSIANSSVELNDEIDLRQISNSISRHKILVLKIALAIFAFSGVYAFIQKPLWEGQFQIVLENPNPGTSGRLAQFSANNPIFANLAGLGGGASSQLETEVVVLESPSVLKPTYDFVQRYKSQKGENTSNWTFLSWRDSNLRIELKKGTSVLNIFYRDTDRDLILPVIEKISQDYQRYSGRDRKRGLTQGVVYLQNQVAELNKQSNISMRQAQSYALTNGLGLQDGMPTALGGIAQKSESSSVEASREAAQNRVNALQQQLVSAKSASDRSVVFKAPQLKANEKLFDQLQGLEAELLHKQTLLKPNNDTIRTLNLRRQNLIAYINQQTIGLLEGELMSARSKLTSLSRPRDVVLRHRELMRTALRDEKTLTELETQLQALQLEQARQADPWELISTPTLLDKPVAPNKKQILAIGLLSGLAIGCGSALIRDRLSDLVFSEKELKKLLPCPLIKHLPATAQETWGDAADLLAAGPLSKDSTSSAVALIPIGKIPCDQLETFSKELSRALNGRELLVSDDLRETGRCAPQLLVTSPGAATRTQISQFSQKLALQGAPLAGWVLLDPHLNQV